MIKEELVEEEPIEEGKEDMADDHGRERQSIVKGKGLSIRLLHFFFFFILLFVNVVLTWKIVGNA